ncbi:PQQ-binding-like beta-propeller repeat protein [Zavarzinella formosa]|uniref:PQQ-binding-like beta-propeller repeat protein n=1 Tax=Zavarzinella formosa TaxID=360055 RepID=UPI0003056C53|nr:PQQ-binding-like beta-propeller repeat protein [Zavarzinella formosa]
MTTRRIALFTLLISAVSVSAADWTRFRGPNGFGIADETGIPTALDAKSLAWKVEIPGRGISSPVISKGLIFLQTASDDGGQRSLIALDEKTGAVKWKQDITGHTAKTHAKNSLASSTPAADGERVYAVFWDGGKISLGAWDYTGKPLWSKDLGKYESQHGPGLSPMVYGNLVILNIDQDGQAELVAYDVKTGDVKWQKSRTPFRASYATPFLTETKSKTELIVSSTAGITSYDPKNGNANWNWKWVFTSKMPLRNVGGSLLHNGMIFAVTGDGGGDRHMVAVKADGTSQKPVWEKKKGTPYVPMMLAKGDWLFWITDKENVAVCVEAKTGREVWSERLGGSGQVYASPLMVGDTIYSVNENGMVFVFKAAGKFDLISKNDLGEEVLASPAVANGHLFIRGDKHLFCYGTK